MPDARLEEIRVKLAGRTRYEGRELTDEEYLFVLLGEAKGVLKDCAWELHESIEEANGDGRDVSAGAMLAEHAARSLLSKLGGPSDG